MVHFNIIKTFPVISRDITNATTIFQLYCVNWGKYNAQSVSDSCDRICEMAKLPVRYK